MVCDTYNCRLQVFRRDGVFVRCFGLEGTGPGRMRGPGAVAVSATNEVFVCDFGNDRIQVFGLDGSFVRSWGSHGAAPGQFESLLAGVAVHRDLVFVSELGSLVAGHLVHCFRTDGTFVRRWGGKGSEPGQFNRPCGLAAVGGEVFVADQNNHRVQVFGLDGTYVRQWGTYGSGAGGQFECPSVLAVSAAGQVLVADQSRVQVFRADGTFVRCLPLPAGPDVQPGGVAVNAWGDIVLSDKRNHCVHVEPVPWLTGLLAPPSRLEVLLELGDGILLRPWLRRNDDGRAIAAAQPLTTPLGGLVRRWHWPRARCWGSRGTLPGQFKDPCGVAVTSAGDVVVCDAGNHRIQMLRPDGSFVRTCKARFEDPAALVISETDEVFVCDHGHHRMQVFRADGNFVRMWGARGMAPGQFQHPAGVALVAGCVWVSDWGNDRIQLFRPDGTFLRSFGSTGAGPGQFDQPQGLAVSTAGDVFVCDMDNHRVQVFDSDGVFRRSWGQHGQAPGQFHYPSFVAVSAAGEVLVSDSTRVQVFAVDGTYIRSVHLPAGAHGAFQPTGVAVTPAGTVLVCDQHNHAVLVETAGC